MIMLLLRRIGDVIDRLIGRLTDCWPIRDVL